MENARKSFRLVTLRVLMPTGIVQVDIVPQRVAAGKLRGLDRDGDRVSMAMVDLIQVEM